MGGKGQRRREKNFLAAHRDYTRLPPAPKASDLDKLPSKLRRLMDFLSPSKTTSTKKLQVHLKTSKDAKIGKCKEDVIGDQSEHGFTAAEFNEKGNHENVKTLEHGSNRDTNTNMDKKGKRKRKRKGVDDLRFQKIDQGSTTTGLSKRERRKKNSGRACVGRSEDYGDSKLFLLPPFCVRLQNPLGHIVIPMVNKLQDILAQLGSLCICFLLPASISKTRIHFRSSLTIELVHPLWDPLVDPIADLVHPSSRKWWGDVRDVDP